MKYIATLLSLFTLFYITQDIVNDNDNENTAQSSDTIKTADAPKKLSAEPLELELKWQAFKRERMAKQNKDGDTQIADSKKQIKIGSQTFILYGIFEHPSQPFALLKNKSGEMLKVAKGDELADNVTLVSLYSNKIAFNRNGEVIEFKLFERKK